MISKFKIFTFSLSILLILFFWKDTIFNISDHLYDWNDSLYNIWVIQNNLNHFRSLDFQNLYDTNAMYPFRYSLSFADQLFFPSLIVLFISIFTQNPIFQFNIFIILNHVLMFLAAYLLCGLIVKNFWSKIIPAFYLSFSPYLFTQYGHIQMIIFWPFLLSLYFLFKDEVSQKLNKKNLLFSGLFFGIQFMSGVYIAIMGFIAVILYFAVKLYFGGKFFKILKKLMIFMAVFLITALISIYGYMLARQEYGGERDIREFIIYSAHLSDYLFMPGGHNSIIYTTPLMGRWKSFDHHNMGEKAAFIGIIPLIVITIYLIKISKKKNLLKISVNMNHLSFFLVILFFITFIFSLGPRLNVNGTYLHIPLPYYVVLEIVPFIEFLRGLARWFFLVTLATTLLLALGLDNIFENLFKKTSQRTVFMFGIIIFILIFLEFYPKSFSVSKKDWWNKPYQYMASEICTERDTAVLEYPFIYRNYDGTLIKDLQYKMAILMASTQHRCKILSGFSGYEPPKYIEIREQLDNDGIDQKDLKLIRDLGFAYLKLNKFAVPEEERNSLTDNLVKFNLKPVYQDNSVDIYKL